MGVLASESPPEEIKPQYALANRVKIGLNARSCPLATVCNLFQQSLPWTDIVSRSNPHDHVSFSI